MSADEVKYMVEQLDIERRLLLDRCAAAQTHARIAGPMQPFPPFGGPQIMVAGPYPVNQFGQGPRNPTLIAPTMPMADRHGRESLVSNGPRSVIDQRGPRGTSSNQPYRQPGGYNGMSTPRQPNGRQHIPPAPPGNDGFRPQGPSNSSQEGQAGPSNRDSISNNSTRQCPEKTFMGSPSGNASMREPLEMYQASPHRPLSSKLTNRVTSTPMPYIPFHIQSTNGHCSSPSSCHPNSFNLTSSLSPGRTFEQNVQRSLSSSNAFHTTRVLPRPSTNFQGPSNDARVLSTSRQPIFEPKLVPNSHNSSMTMWYVPRTDTSNRNARTVHVNRINKDMFLNHVLKVELERYGVIENIHFLPSGSCFVLFTEPVSAERAIRDCNGRNLFGYTLKVSEPIGATRARSGSDASRASQNYHNGGSHSSRRDSEAHPHRMSNRTSATYSYDPARTRNPSAGTHMIGSSPNRRDRGLCDKQLGSHLHASLTEISQHSNALTRYDQHNSTSLEDIANIFNNKKKAKQTPDTKTFTHQAVPQAGSMVKKENVGPRKRATPSRTFKHTKANKKGSKQNTSAHPTPTASPMKPSSAANAKKFSVLSLSVTTQKVEKLHALTVNGSQKGPNKSNKSGKKGSDSSKSGGSFSTDATFEAVSSPTESAPSPLSNISGRTHSLAIEKASIKRSQSAADLPGHASGQHVVTQSKGNKGKKYRGPKNEAKTINGSVDLQVRKSIPGKPQAAKTQKAKKPDPSATGHSKKSSTTSTASKASKKKDDTPSGKSRTTDQSPTSASGSIKQTVKTEFHSPSLNDHEWPSLEPAKPPFVAADCKLPPPVMGPLMAAAKDAKKKPAVPTVAVPRAFETRPQP
ncbi:hypothetical protein QTJ16_003069 [Diplocarpon rosae]|uniref:RRM domain-containing protein n=1 Tax=Diplocarpon rosae TaxID=946125 RepID=A0AAD9T1H7_9HELO|nr:hypothetical protein QTJ16_003069 [Diplocarpon rosae]